MPESDDNNFLQRWSRRKRGIEPESETKVGSHDGPSGSGVHSPATKELGAERGSSQAGVDVDKQPTEVETEESIPPELADVDIDALDYSSDYTRFLKDGVPEALKRRALRQLWRSDPILANVDGLNDYDGDFTDAAMVVDVLKTVHKVGRGYLSDDETDVDDDDLDVGDGEDGDSVASSETLEAAEAKSGIGDDVAKAEDGAGLPNDVDIAEDGDFNNDDELSKPAVKKPV